jgi:hypothetical protein
MIERLILRASDALASGGDPLAAVKPDLIVGPIVRTFGALSLATKNTTLNIITNSLPYPLQLIGLVLNVWLYGMQLMQVETYFRSNPRFVSYLFSLSTTMFVLTVRPGAFMSISYRSDRFCLNFASPVSLTCFVLCARSAGSSNVDFPNCQ